MSVAIIIILVSFRVNVPFAIRYSSLTNDTILYPEETHFKNIQQLTFGGDNAEAYFSFDSKWLIFQRTNLKEGLKCDQMFIGKVPTQPGEKFEYTLVRMVGDALIGLCRTAEARPGCGHDAELRNQPRRA